MTAEERAALIDRLAPLIIEERRKAAEQNPKRPPWYMMNIAHPVMVWLYNQYLAKLGEVSPPGDACRTRFELSILHPAVLKSWPSTTRSNNPAPAGQICRQSRTRPRRPLNPPTVAAWASTATPLCR